ncbi:MAG: hypothetical protein IT557_14695 [Alphaproteobacteria bacterium]|nr:hypothetical protein [Alphaproteobacteria bacterium]
MAAAAALAALVASAAPGARAQDLGLSGSGPIEIDAAEGIEWRQAERIVIARGNARATRQNVTVHADRLIARYRERARPGEAPPAPQPGRAAAEGPLAGGGANEIWRLEAEGNVRIVAAADRAEGDRAVYDLDQAVLVLTGRNLRILAGSDEVRARDSLEYWSQRRMAVARGGASVTSGDRRLDAAVLVAYLAAPPPPGAARPQAPPPTSQAQGGGAPLAGALGGSGRIERVEAFDEVLIRTPTESVRGDRGVYLPETGIAQITGQVRITRGQNQLNGGFAEVNLRTGVARLLGGPPGGGGTAPGGSGGRVSGLVVPNEGQAEGAQPQPQQQQQQRRPANAAPRRLAP